MEESSLLHLGPCPHTFRGSSQHSVCGEEASWSVALQSGYRAASHVLSGPRPLDEQWQNGDSDALVPSVIPFYSPWIQSYEAFMPPWRQSKMDQPP